MPTCEATKSQLYYMRQEILSGLTSVAAVVPLRRKCMPPLLRHGLSVTASLTALSLLLCSIPIIKSFGLLNHPTAGPEFHVTGSKGVPMIKLPDLASSDCEVRLSVLDSDKRSLLSKDLDLNLWDLPQSGHIIPSFYCSHATPGSFVHLRVEIEGRVWQKSLNNKFLPMSEMPFTIEGSGSKADDPNYLVLHNHGKHMTLTVGISSHALTSFDTKQMQNIETLKLRSQKEQGYGG